MSLSIGVKNQLAQCGTEQIEAVLRLINTELGLKAWLSNSSVYRRDSLDQIKLDFGSGQGNKTDLAKFVGASVLTHSVDAWSYFGRALSAYLNGDVFSAIHLAYYCEFRAASAILAHHGIGVFDDLHAVVASDGKATIFPGGGAAHVFIWDALEHLSSTPMFTEFVLSAVGSNNCSLNDRLEQFDAKYSGGALTTNWIKNWGLDLQQLARDKAGRNIVSYTPTAFTAVRAPQMKRCIAYVAAIWKLLEPSGSDRFQVLDKYLVRHAIRSIYESAHGNLKSSGFKDRVRRMVEGIALSEEARKQEYKFIVNDAPKRETIILDNASGTKSPYDSGYAEEILARALVLLRLATGGSAKLLRGAGIPRARIDFWLDAIGEDRCLWIPKVPPQDFDDLWADIRDAVSTLTDWSEAGSEDCFFHLWGSKAKAAACLTTSERAALWGICG